MIDQLDKILAQEQARRMGDLYDELDRMRKQKQVQKAVHAAHIRRLIKQYGRENVLWVLNVLVEDCK